MKRLAAIISRRNFHQLPQNSPKAMSLRVEQTGQENMEVISNITCFKVKKSSNPVSSFSLLTLPSHLPLSPSSLTFLSHLPLSPTPLTHFSHPLLSHPIFSPTPPTHSSSPLLSPTSLTHFSLIQSSHPLLPPTPLTHSSHPLLSPTSLSSTLLTPSFHPLFLPASNLFQLTVSNPYECLRLQNSNNNNDKRVEILWK